MPIARYLSQSNLQRMKKDFGFLVGRVARSRGELHLALRDNYFNLYFRGNSMAKVDFAQSNFYRVEVAGKFSAPLAQRAQERGIVSNSGRSRVQYLVAAADIHWFLQKKHLEAVAREIRAVQYGEEIEFEQALIADNCDREDLIVIDRQVSYPGLRDIRMDLLALRQVNSNNYHFQILEVKLGNNPELSGAVAQQLERYKDHITKHLSDYKACYEINFAQQKQLGLLPFVHHPAIKITPDVDGLVVVGRYPGQATSYLATLGQNHPNLPVKVLSHRL